MIDSERRVLRELGYSAHAAAMERINTWMFRALLMSTVLEDLGYSTRNIMNGDKEVLDAYIDMAPADIIYCLQMKGG